jgi:hypothetical protein
VRPATPCSQKPSRSGRRIAFALRTRTRNVA